MPVCLATSVAMLVHCVEVANPGDRVDIAPGSYGDLVLDRINKSGTVTIQPADPRNPPIFNGRFYVRQSSGLTFKGMQVNARLDMPVQMFGSSRIVIDGFEVGAPPEVGNDRPRGLMIRNSDHVTVQNSHFYNLAVGVGHHMTQYTTIADNVFERINVDGIDGGGGNDLTIDGNVFYNFDHTGNLHPDMIQVWTTFNTQPNRNFHITGNLFVRGAIGIPVQGVFVGNEKGIPHEGMVVTDNVVIGANYNSVAVALANDAVIERNLAIGVTDQKSWLAARGGTATVEDNVASMINIVPGTRAKTRHNTTVRLLSMGELATLNTFVTTVKPGQTQGFADQVRSKVLAMLHARMPGTKDKP